MRALISLYYIALLRAQALANFLYLSRQLHPSRKVETVVSNRSIGSLLAIYSKEIQGSYGIAVEVAFPLVIYHASVVTA